MVFKREKMVILEVIEIGKDLKEVLLGVAAVVSFLGMLYIIGKYN